MNEYDDAIKPTHYTTNAIEPVTYIIANQMDFLEGNIIKYVSRYKAKNGLEDLEKASWYLNELIRVNMEE